MKDWELIETAPGELRDRVENLRGATGRLRTQVVGVYTGDSYKQFVVLLSPSSTQGVTHYIPEPLPWITDMTMLDGKCECCEKEKPLVGVASLPYIPMSIAWCVDCLRADVMPFWAVVANTAMIGGMDKANDDWKDMVERSLTYHGKTRGEFDAAVAEDIKRLENYVPPEHPMPDDEEPIYDF